MFILGIYFLLKPNNILTSRIMFTLWDKKTIQRNYGKKFAQNYVRITGFILIIFSIIFYFFVR